ncbi:MAG: ABC transporter ATP-binding protein [Wenzhouxiangella sp.]
MNDTVIKARGLGYRYGRQPALDCVDLSCRSGSLTALLGPNGAGKTTLVKLLLGVFAPQNGSLRVAGGDPRQRHIRQQIGTMLQISGVPETLTVAELVAMFSSFYPTPMRSGKALATARLEDLANRRFGKLSGGQRQRVLLALALVGQPRILILDEPASGLDPASRRALGESIRAQRELGTAILLCTHDLEEAERLADEVVILNKGRIIASDSPRAIAERLPGRRVRCRTRLSTDIVSGLPGVRQVQNAEGVTEALVTEPNEFVRALLEADKDLTGLEVTGARLEEAFMTLTQPDLENAA